MNASYMPSSKVQVFAIAVMVTFVYSSQADCDCEPIGQFVASGSSVGLYAVGNNSVTLSQEGKQWFEKASNGDPSAQYEFAKFLNHQVGGHEVSPPIAIEAFAWAMLSARQGNADGENYVGMCYQTGEGVVSNAQESVRWFVKAIRHGSSKAKYNLARHYVAVGDFKKALVLVRNSAEEGYAPSQLLLGKMCLNGQGMSTNKTLAIEWIRKAADQEDAGALNMLALCYQLGDGVPTNKTEAIRLYEQVVSQTNNPYQAAIAKVMLASIYTVDCTVAGEHLAIKWIEAALRRSMLKELRKTELAKNISDLQYQAGVHFKYGWGCEKNGKKARQYLRESSDNGNLEAFYELADGYEKGSLDSKDPCKAIDMYMLLARRDHVKGIEKVGWCHINGIGVEKNEMTGVKWLNKAADMGSASAQHAMGWAYWNGVGVRKDFVKAYEWYKKAADGHNINAILCLATCYRTGAGIEKDDARAVSCWREAAEAGNAAAQYNLACCYTDGTGLEKDIAKAAFWFRKAAGQGNVDSQFALGTLYKSGKGVVKDSTAARTWLRKALDGGKAEAKDALDAIAAEERNRVERELAEKRAKEKTERVRKETERKQREEEERRRVAEEEREERRQRREQARQEQEKNIRSASKDRRYWNAQAANLRNQYKELLSRYGLTETHFALTEGWATLNLLGPGFNETYRIDCYVQTGYLSYTSTMPVWLARELVTFRVRIWTAEY